MPDKKISELTELTTPSDLDELPIVHKSIGETKKVKYQNVIDHAPKTHGNEVHSSTFITGAQVPANETDPSVDATLKGITLTEVRDHSPKAHNTSHEYGGSDVVALRRIVVPLTNKSGVALAEGDVVIVDSANNEAVTTTTTAGNKLFCGAVLVGGANNAIVQVIVCGYAGKVLTTLANGTGRGYFLKTTTVAKKAEGTSTASTAGYFGVALTHADASGYVSAVIRLAEYY